MLCFVRDIFDTYIHWFRIPAVIFGIFYSISASYIVSKTIKNRIFALAILAAVLFSKQVFDYSYLARGYAISLGAYFAGIALIFYLLKKKLSFHFCWVPTLLLVLIISSASARCPVRCLFWQR
jgi:predicted membrane-bound spermidine synthase